MTVKPVSNDIDDAIKKTYSTTEMVSQASRRPSIVSFLMSSAWMIVTRRLSPDETCMACDGNGENQVFLEDSTTKQDLASLDNALLQLFFTKKVSPQFCLHTPTNLIHVRQGEQWDCGITCIQMAMAWLRPDGHESREWMLKTIGTESIWSIDLIYLLSKLLKKEEASYLLSSKTLGVDETHGVLGYYKKAFSQDEVRVRQRFEEARRAGLPLLCLKHLSLSQVIRLVSRDDCIAIVLLDNSILRQRVGATYAGHYVILSGISFQRNHLNLADVKRLRFCMVIKNPARSATTTYVRPSLFEAAWRANGTDDDILFVTKP